MVKMGKEGWLIVVKEKNRKGRPGYCSNKEGVGSFVPVVKMEKEDWLIVVIKRGWQFCACVVKIERADWHVAVIKRGGQLCAALCHA